LIQTDNDAKKTKVENKKKSLFFGVVFNNLIFRINNLFHLENEKLEIFVFQMQVLKL
jgi:hypothetical protein